MSDTVNLNLGSKPLDYIPGIKKPAPHQTSVQPIHKPLLRRIFDRPDTYRTRPSYIRPILGHGPSHPIKPKSKREPQPDLTATPKSKLHAHFAKPGPTVQTQATDAMGALTDMRMKVMVQHAKEEDRRRSGVLVTDQEQEQQHQPPPSRNPSPSVSPFVPETTPRTKRADTSRARVGTRPQSAGAESIDRTRRPSQEAERKKRDRRSIDVGREAQEYYHPNPESFASVPVAAPGVMHTAIPAGQAHQQPHQQYQHMNHLPTHLHLHPRHQPVTVIPRHFLVNQTAPNARATQPADMIRDPYTKSKSEHCFTSFFQAIRDIFLTLGHLCSTIGSGVLTGLLGLVHVILTSLLLFAAIIADIMFTFLTYFFIIISCHCCSGDWRPKTRFTTQAWTFGRESQWVWNFIDDFTRSVTSGVPHHVQQDGHHGPNTHSVVGGGRDVPMDIEKGLPQGPVPIKTQNPRAQQMVAPQRPPHRPPASRPCRQDEDSIIPSSDMTPRTRRKAALAFIRPRSSRTPSTIDPSTVAERRWTDKMLGLVGLEIVWEETERDRVV